MLYTTEQEKKEIEFWKNSEYESPSNFSIETVVYKLAEAKIFLEKIKKYEDFFKNSNNILEIGAGQGWASCILKKLYPHKNIYCSDISKYAIESLKHWEKLFQVKVDKEIVCNSYKIPLPDNCMDTIFCFQSAHHFRKHEKTLKEIYRVLKPMGHCIYLFEPSCKSYIYKPAYKRVNRKRPEVPEDILIYKNILNLANNAGFQKNKIQFSPTLTNRGPFETIYYYILQKIKFLQKLLPCTADYFFQKNI